VVLCASRKIDEIWVRNSLSGLSSGTSPYGEESLEAVEARELSVCTEDLWDTAADVCADLVVDTRLGIVICRFSTCSISTLVL
jgi:hypothetical protein